MKQTPFQLVTAMNTAFGNKIGNPQDFMPVTPTPSDTATQVHFNTKPWDRLRNQCKNILDEYHEVMGCRSTGKVGAIQKHDIDGVRDGLCDIMVFALGAYHMLGLDADVDMEAVLTGVMTRFIRDEEDKSATILKHAAKGVSQVYFEGQYPTMIMKSAVDQPDAPKGKFLKSASYTDTVFAMIPQPVEAL